MTWFKVDDKLHSHPKTTGVSLAALGLWAVAGSWCGDHLTDGRVPLHMIPLLSRGVPALADELVVARLWVRVKDGYKFHDWDAYQPSSKEVAKLREARAAAGRKGGLARAKTHSKRASKSVASARAPASEATKQNPTPSRPSSSYEEERDGGPPLRAGSPVPSRASPPYGDEDPRVIAADQQRLIDLAADREREQAEEAERAVIGGQLVRDELARRRAAK